MSVFLFLIPFIGAFSNMFLRGGGIESWLLKYKSIPGIKYVNAVVFGICSYLVVSDLSFAILMSLVMTLGQMSKIPHQDTILGKVWPMTLRGMAWCTPIFIACLVSRYNPVFFIIPAFMMYPAYRLPILYYETRPWNKYLNQVTVAEMIYGFLLYLPLLTLRSL